MENKPPIYPYSVKEARERGELDAWRESFRENCTCAGGIEISIRENFEGMYLKDGAVSKIIEQFGYKRVAYVLANTVQELSYDGRFSSANKDWATYVYKVGMGRSSDFSYAAAIGLFNSVINCTLLVAVNAIVKKLSDKEVSLF